MDAGAVLLIEIDGPAADVRRRPSEIARICRESGATEVRAATDKAERDLLWKGRKMALGAMGRLAPNYYLHDTVVPRSKLPATLRGSSEVSREYDLPIANVFHAGDGNLHPLILFDRRKHGRRSSACCEASQRDPPLLRRGRRRALRRARHRHREARLHDAGLHRRGPGGDGRAEEQPSTRAAASTPRRSSRRATCAARSGRCGSRRWRRSMGIYAF